MKALFLPSNIARDFTLMKQIIKAKNSFCSLRSITRQVDLWLNNTAGNLCSELKIYIHTPFGLKEIYCTFTLRILSFTREVCEEIRGSEDFSSAGRIRGLAELMSLLYLRLFVTLDMFISI